MKKDGNDYFKLVVVKGRKGALGSSLHAAVSLLCRKRRNECLG